MNAGVPAAATITTFFDSGTWTATHLLACTATKQCVIIDPVWNYDAAAGALKATQVEAIDRYVQAHGLAVALVLDTHMHADHITAGDVLRKKYGVKYGIGASCRTVQATFKAMYALDWFTPDMSQFDLAIADDQVLSVGELTLRAISSPGHTPGCLSYYCPQAHAVFVGDTIFMPDMGSARCDFPGGSAHTLYRSIHRVLDPLAEDVVIYVGHDYQPGGRPLKWAATVADQRTDNIHVRSTVHENEFVEVRTKRDSTLGYPNLLLPALQVNINGGMLPPADAHGKVFLKIPIKVVA